MRGVAVVALVLGMIGALTSSAAAAGAPANDLCMNAIGPLAVGSSTPGMTTSATFDDVGTCDVTNTEPGVWYTVVGTGNTMTVDTCTNTHYDSKISVFSGSCDAPICIGGNDDGCGSLYSTVSWCSQAGTVYTVLVHGTTGAVPTGDFELAVTDDKKPCNTPAPAVSPWAMVALVTVLLAIRGLSIRRRRTA